MQWLKKYLSIIHADSDDLCGSIPFKLNLPSQL